ncbi:YjfB family protein [Lacrimispora sp. JR3]|uniref:YjfB family protein n=1 Tax=Lacrimispora sinapis TaxID=3111456 RepID=UPI0037489B04
MDIAAVSMEMSTARLQQSASLSVAKKAMDYQEQQAAGLLDMMSQTASAQLPGSGVGHIIDVKA